jgi:hypothetical protein
MAEDVFRLPRSSYQEIVKIIQAYDSVGAETSLTDVGQIAVMDTSTISKNVKFLIGIGILQGKKMKSLTPLGDRLGKALNHKIEDDISRYWGEAVQRAQFTGKVLAALRIRNGMEASALSTHIAYTAGEQKTAATQTGARAIIEILAKAGLIVEEGGTFTAASVIKKLVAEPIAPESSASDIDRQQVSQTAIHQEIGFEASTEGTSLAINVTVNVDCTVGELGEVGDQLRKMMESLAQPAKLTVKEG